ncbi:MAG: hypothetical protein HQK78_18705 [Desulfobacterales bacterium]|nr:hypothetical protein [Desulfobacterales bacterium]
MNIEEKITIPKELLWDYKEPPDDIFWQLQRIVDFFPAYGTDINTVKLLFKHRDKLKMEYGKYKLIGMYNEVWEEKSSQRN